MSRRILSLLLCFAAMAICAYTVNHALFGHRFDTPATETAKAKTAITPSDTVSVGDDGSITIHTAALCPDAEGFNGPVSLDITVADGKITAITPLPNNETPSYFAAAEEILKSYIGLDINTAPRADAVSGATYSSNAILDNIHAAIAWYKTSSFAQASATAPADEAPAPPAVPLKIWIALAVTLCACIVPLFVHNRYYYIAQLVANILILGLWAGTMLSYGLMLKMLSFGVDFIPQLTLVLMLIAAFIYPLLGRPEHYCNHICPLGSAQILAAMICKKKIRLSQRLVRTLTLTRRILWAILMLLLVGSAFTQWANSELLATLSQWPNYELFAAFSIEHAPLAMLIIFAAFLILSLFIPRPYCRFICPTGTLQKLSHRTPITH